MNRFALSCRGLVAAIGLLSPGSFAVAQTPVREPAPEGLVWYVLNTLNGVWLDIDDPTNRPPLITEVPDGVLEPVEVNGDGQTDWLIRWPEAVQFCGTGGCRVTLYISDGNGLVRAFDRQALGFGVAGEAGSRRIETVLHPINCESDRDECRYVWIWDAPARRLRLTASGDGIEGSDVPRPVEEWGAGAKD